MSAPVAAQLPLLLGRRRLGRPVATRLLDESRPVASRLLEESRGGRRLGRPVAAVLLDSAGFRVDGSRGISGGGRGDNRAVPVV